MSRFLLVMAAVFLGTGFSLSQTTVPAGDVDGVWTVAGSPYLVAGNITVPTGQTLTIEPGVVVRFQGHYRLSVQGRLLAEGTPSDTIAFTAENPSTGWNGIRFNATPLSNDTSRFLYCRFQYGKANVGTERNGGAMLIYYFSKVLVSHCLLSDNSTNGDVTSGGGAIAVNAGSPRIVSNVFVRNAATGGHGGAILIGYASSNPVIENNVIVGNTAYGGGGVACAYATPALINNTIAGNSADHGGALDCIDAAPALLNTILHGNSATIGSQVHLHGVTAEPGFFCCDVQGGTAAFARDHLPGGTFSGQYVGNMDISPLFADTLQGDYTLRDDSPCIGGGIDSAYDVPRSRWLRAPHADCGGGVRPEPAGSSPDIGAWEHPFGAPVVGVGELVGGAPVGFLLEEGYPNPFNPASVIGYRLPVETAVDMRVYTSLGREVAVLVDEVRPAGHHRAVWRAEQQAGGAYFCRLRAGSFSRTIKLLLVK